MAAEQIVPGLYAIPLGIVNAFYLDDPEGGVLIDTGFPKNADKILAALAGLSKKPGDIRHILLTHTHADHIGSAAALVKASGSARTYMHPLDAPIAEAGRGFRPMRPAPGLRNRLFAGFIHFRVHTLGMTVEPCHIDARVEDGAVLPLAGGITAVHAPGHCLGQLAFHWPRHGGVLFAADSCGNAPKLDWSIAYEDIAEGERSLHKLARLDFEVACFGHGKPILKNAATRFRKRWPEPADAARAPV